MKSLFRWSLAATAAGCTFVLAACGGGGGESGSPSTPTKSLTLAGIVTDSPISGALVTVKVGSQTFTAVAGSDGRYRVPMTIPADAGTNLIVIEARGPASGPNAKVSLLSIARSFNSLLAAAGADNELNATESPSVNVTHLSTANGVLIIEVNGGTPTTDAALEQAENQIDPQQALELAAAIKLIVDRPTEYALPTGNTNTLQFAQNQPSRDSFIKATKESSPEDFEQAKEQTVNDPQVVAPPVAGSMPSSLTYVAPMADQNSFNFIRQANLFTFASGGTGTYVNRDGKAATHWTLNGNAIELTLDTPLTLPTYTTLGYDSERQDQYVCEVQESYSKINLRRLSERTARILSSGTVSKTCTYLNSSPGFESTDTLKTETFSTLFKEEDALAAPDLGAARAFGLYTLNAALEDNEFARLSADLLSFNPGGSGTSKYFAGNFTWVKSADGKTLTVTFASGIQASYQVLRKVDDRAAVTLIKATKPDGQTYADLNLRIEPGALDPITASVVPGAYYSFGVGDEDRDHDPDRRLKGFWLEYYNDGSGRQITETFEEDENGNIVKDDQGQPIVIDSRGSVLGQFFWKSTSDSITNTRTYDRSYQGYAEGFGVCREGEDNCSVWDRRELFLLNFVTRADSDRVYVLERRQLGDIFNGITETDPTYYQLRFFDILDLPNAAKSAPSTGPRPSSARDPERPNGRAPPR